jgi:signal transduction histidine kinase
MNKQRNAILSSISHEFKNPVAVIIGYAETLQEDSSDPMQQRFLNKIVQNGNKISTMISRMNLSLSLEYNDFTLQKEMIDIRTLVHDVVSNMQKKYKDRTIHLTNHSRRLHIDPTLFDMLITNLIDNALKYSQDDIFVTVSDKSLSVEDQGIGIAQDDIDNITQRFYRVSKNRWDNSLGLGLSIVQFIVKLHDMQLRIDSTVGEGSTFKVIWQLGEESGE